MTTGAQCPQCGSVLPEGILQGLCVRCVARQAESILAAQTGATASPSDATQHATRNTSSTIHYFGDYELLEEIARGGMGVVWKARQVSLNRLVAVKMLLAGKFSNPEFVERFRAEAQAAANLQHPNIVAIHEVGEHEEQQYFSMDYVEGQNLSQLVRDQPLPPRRAAAYLRAVAEAVHYAHERGVLHRDLKPANILIDPADEPRVTDFGLAKRLETNPGFELTLTGQVLGTPGFMSPEQAGGKRGAVSAASDVYSLGAVLYFLVTGRAPFAAGSLEETLRQVHEAEPVSPRLLNPAVPRDLETICLKCLSKEPARRYTTAQELSEDIGRFLNDEPIQARPGRLPEKIWRWCRRKPALATLMLALIIVGTGGLSGILWQWRRATEHRQLAEQHAARETVQRVRAEEAVTMLELQRVEDLLEKDEITMGVAYLARIVRQQPTNQIASRRLLSALTQRNFALPVGAPMRHSKRVWHAEFSPDGRRIVTAGLDLHAAVWDARTGALVFAMAHPQPVRTACFSPDGTRILTVDDNQARLWDANTGRVLGQSMDHRYRVGTDPAQFSPDGERVLTIQADGSARLWDGHTGEPALEPLRHEGPINGAAFNSTGSHFATCSSSWTARIWETRTGQLTGRLGHPAVVWGVAFSPDGKRLLTAAGDFLIRVWEVSSGQLLNSVPTPSALHYSVARFSPDGERILTVLSSGAGQIWSARDGTALTRPMLHRSTVWSAEFSPEGQRVLTASLDSTARLWDAANGEPLTAPLEHKDLAISGRFSPDGSLAVTAGADGSARIWDLRPGAVRSQLLPTAVRWAGARFSPDGEWIASSEEGTAPRLWHARTLQPGPLLADAPSVIDMCWSADSRQVATFCVDGKTWIWDAQTGAAVTGPIHHAEYPTDFQFSPDGNWIAAACHDRKLRQWNTHTGQLRGEPLSDRSKIECFAYSPDGQRLFVSHFREDQARVHDAASMRLLAQTPPRQGRIMHGDFSPDGRRLITASEDGIARIWRTETLEPLTEPLRHKSSVLWTKFSRDGRRVVTASEDGTARVWDAQSGQTIGEPLVHRAAVGAAEFSPDGLLIVTTSRDGMVRLWDADTGRPVSEPFVHSGKHVGVSFSPDGRRLLTVSAEDGPRPCDVPPVTHNANFQSVVADVADAVIGKRVNPQGALESVSGEALIRAREAVASLPRDADLTRWLEWFFSDRSTRAISPESQVSLPDYVLARAQETNKISWREALTFCPTNGLAFAQMARHHLQRSKGANSLEAGLADWASRQAVKFAPEHRQPWQRRIDVMEHTGGWTQLMVEAEQVLQSQSANAHAWIAKSRCLHELGQLEVVGPANTSASEISNRELSFQAGLAHVLQPGPVTDPARLIEEGDSIHSPEILEEAIRQQPYNAVFWNAKGLLHEKAGQIQRAEAAFARALEVASLPAVGWDFERTSHNWKPLHHMANMVLDRGIFSFETGEDPYLELYLPPVDGAVHRWLHVRMKNATPRKEAQVYWGTVTDPEFHEPRVIGFPILPNDPQFTVYTVDMRHTAWIKNRIVRLRFDPVSWGAGGRIEIDWICLHTDSKPPAEVSGWGEIANPEMRRQALSNLVRLRRR